MRQPSTDLLKQSRGPVFRSWVVEAMATVEKGGPSTFAILQLSDNFVHHIISQVMQFTPKLRVRTPAQDNIPARAQTRSDVWGVPLGPVDVTMRFQSGHGALVTFGGDSAPVDGEWKLALESEASVLSFVRSDDGRETAPIPLRRLAQSLYPDTEGQVEVLALEDHIPLLGDVLAEALHSGNTQTFQLSADQRELVKQALLRCMAHTPSYNNDQPPNESTAP